MSLTAARDEALARGPFDLVVCSLVLCTLPEGDDYERVWDDLRAAVAPAGTVVVAVCDPLFTHSGPTPRQTRFVPAGCGYTDTFSWEKVVESTGRRRTDVHRPLERLERDARRRGLTLVRQEEVETVDLVRFEPASDFRLLFFRPAPLEPKVSLLIKTCAMEGATIERQVEHLVRQLDAPRCFTERVLVVDSRQDGFARAHAPGDPTAHGLSVEALVSRGVVDRVVLGPASPDEVQALNLRWFGLTAPATHAANGGQVASTLAGFEACSGEYLLQFDADMIVHRADRTHDYLAEMIDVLARDPEALTVAFNVPHADVRPYTASSADGPWRVEVRAALFHRERLLASRPWRSQACVNGSLKDPWHRVLDAHLQTHGLGSYRGGNPKTAAFHVPNHRKAKVDPWLLALNAVEEGWLPRTLVGHAELPPETAWEELLGPPRAERFVFVVTGRNVPPGRLLRCVDSIRCQRRKDWGVVLVDDASDDPRTRAFSAVAAGRLGESVTLLRPNHRQGLLANLVTAVRHVCVDPATVVITLDADDALLGEGVLDRLAAAYEEGADMTVGSMLRTDKHRTYAVGFSDPRGQRGANVWQHLRSFRKRLFDAVPDEDLRLDGRYVDVATDWAFMVPMVEIAAHPVALGEALYLYEPSGRGKGAERCHREEVIGRLLSKPWRSPLRRQARRPVVAVAGDAGAREGSVVYETARQVGRALVASGFRVLTGGLGGVMEAASRGAREAPGSGDADVIALLPGLDAGASNPYAGVVLTTGFDAARNALVAQADALIAVGGGAGTLSEIALAWTYRRPVVAMRGAGWSGRLADERVDGRRRRTRVPGDRVFGADDPEEAVAILRYLLPLAGTPRRRLGGGS